MSLSKRHVGRRVAGVIVAASLLVLGLEAPAFADTTVTAVSPTSGPDDCVVVVTGTGFRTFPDSVNTLNFVAPDGTTKLPSGDWFSISDTEIWAVVPAALVAGTSYTVQVTQPSGTNTAGGTFLSTGDTAPGACAPTIASFTPTCGSAADIVTITGTNLLSAANLSSVNSGGDVFFRNTAAAETEASQPVPDLSEPTSISAIVPSDIADGPIHVFTGVDANPTAGDQGVFSTASFLTPPPDCVPVGPTTHERNVRLRLRSHLIGKGKVTVPDGTTECAQNVPVKIQRKRSGGWRTLKATNTSATGSFKKRLPDKPGVYRAVARKITLPDTGDVCLKDVSNRVRHRH